MKKIRPVYKNNPQYLNMPKNQNKNLQSSNTLMKLQSIIEKDRSFPKIVQKKYHKTIKNKLMIEQRLKKDNVRQEINQHQEQDILKKLSFRIQGKENIKLQPLKNRIECPNEKVTTKNSTPKEYEIKSKDKDFLTDEMKSMFTALHKRLDVNNKDSDCLMKSLPLSIFSDDSSEHKISKKKQSLRKSLLSLNQTREASGLQSLSQSIYLQKKQQSEECLKILGEEVNRLWAMQKKGESMLSMCIEGQLSIIQLKTWLKSKS